MNKHVNSLDPSKLLKIVDDLDKHSQPQKSHVTSTHQNTRFETYDDMIDALRQYIVFSRMSSLNKLNNATKIKLSTDDITDTFVELCDLAIENRVNFDDTLYMYSPETKMMSSDIGFFEKVIHLRFNSQFKS